MIYGGFLEYKLNDYEFILDWEKFFFNTNFEKYMKRTDLILIKTSKELGLYTSYMKAC